MTRLRGARAFRRAGNGAVRATAAPRPAPPRALTSGAHVARGPGCGFAAPPVARCTA